jgi:hypothetical protein
LGIGLRKKLILGLKNIDVYAFGNHIYWILDYKHFFLAFNLWDNEHSVFYEWTIMFKCKILKLLYWFQK